LLLNFRQSAGKKPNRVWTWARPEDGEMKGSTSYFIHERKSCLFCVIEKTVTP
jgi:hypothetical protein